MILTQAQQDLTKWEKDNKNNQNGMLFFHSYIDYRMYAIPNDNLKDLIELESKDSIYSRDKILEGGDLVKALDEKNVRVYVLVQNNFMHIGDGWWRIGKENYRL